MTTPGSFTRPNIARVCDVLAGGFDNLAPDRELAGRLLEICPDLSSAVRENRAFIARAADWAARQGIRQFADLGTGQARASLCAPRSPCRCPSVRLVYVDNDLAVTSHVRALLVTDGGVAAVGANLTDPASVLADAAWLGVIGMAEPVCLVFGLVLSLMHARQAREVVAAYADRVAPGSYVMISGRCDDEALWKQLSEAYTAAGIYNHSPGEIEGFLAGLELVPRGSPRRRTGVAAGITCL